MNLYDGYLSTTLYVVDDIRMTDKKKLKSKRCFQSVPLSVSVDIRMSKAVDDDKMGTEFPVDSTGKKLLL